MGQRNTRTIPRYSGIGSEGLTRRSKVLAQQLVEVNGRVVRKVGSRRETLSELAIRVVVGTRLPVFQQMELGGPVSLLLFL